MEYIIIALLIVLIYIVYKQCNVVDNFIVPNPNTSTEYVLKGQIYNQGNAERSFGPPVFLNGEHYEYNCPNNNGEKDNCNAVNGGCICGVNCKSNNCVEPRWKWNQRWIERAKLEMKKDQMDIQNELSEHKKCC